MHTRASVGVGLSRLLMMHSYFSFLTRQLQGSIFVVWRSFLVEIFLKIIRPAITPRFRTHKHLALQWPFITFRKKRGYERIFCSSLKTQKHPTLQPNIHRMVLPIRFGSTLRERSQLVTDSALSDGKCNGMFSIGDLRNHIYTLSALFCLNVAE